MRADVVVVGAGLGGLLTAKLLEREGREVVVLDRATPGGRARSQRKGGATWNLGPHAIYRRGELAALLRDLGIPTPGGVPGGAMLGLLDGERHPLPVGAMTIATSPLAAGDRTGLLALFAGLPLTSAARWAGRPGSEWLAQVSGTARQTLEALVRVSTYCGFPEQLDAGHLHRQMQRVLGGVTYVDGGWQTVVDQLARPVVRDTVRRVEPGRVAGDATYEADHVVVATDAASWTRLTGERLERTPVNAATLCLGLGSLPSPDAFLLGIDDPLYCSVHSAVADLGCEVVHTARYLSPGQVGVRADLERFTDALLPGYEAHVSRFLPCIEVVGDIPTPGRPRAAVDVAPGLSRVGDWIGEDGLLADTVAASAMRAVEGILRRSAA